MTEGEVMELLRGIVTRALRKSQQTRIAVREKFHSEANEYVKDVTRHSSDAARVFQKQQVFILQQWQKAILTTVKLTHLLLLLLQPFGSVRNGEQARPTKFRMRFDIIS